MKYKKTKPRTVSVSAPAVTGAKVGGPRLAAGALPAFYPWMPSTWPAPPANFDANFVETLKHIFDETMLGEIENVIQDVTKSNGDLQHRGHVVAISLLCALDAISSYGYGAKSGKQIPAFIHAHFPSEYRPHAEGILYLCRHAMVHSWNLFGAAISPGVDSPKKVGGALSFGLLNFFQALKKSVGDFLKKLETDVDLQRNTLNRYRQLRRTAKP